MPHFKARMTAEDGRVVVEPFLAISSADCRRHFEALGYCVLSIRRDWSKIRLSALTREKRIKDRDFIMFNQELAALVRAGYPVLKSLEVIASRAKNPLLREVLGRVETDIKQGKSLSDAFAPFEDRFSTIYTAALLAGEQSGNLPETLAQFIQYAKVVSRTKARIRSALIYPTLLLAFSTGLLGVLVNFVLPNFADFYRDFDVALPYFTQALIDFSVFVRGHWALWIVLAIAAVAAFRAARRRPAVRIRIERMKLRIPLGNVIWLESAVALFCRTLGLLLQAGVSLVTAVGLASKAMPNAYLVSRTVGLAGSIKNGETLSESLVKSGIFPPLALDMVRIGETSANLGGMLREVADVFDESIQSRIDTFVSLIEPLVIILMGLLVAAMLLSVYTPIFNMIKVAR